MRGSPGMAGRDGRLSWDTAMSASLCLHRSSRPHSQQPSGAASIMCSLPVVARQQTV